MVKVVFVILVFLSILAIGFQVRLHRDCADSNVTKSVTYVRNYDGDTVVVNVPQWPHLFGKNISIRIRGIDTPEIKTNNACEKRKAIEARNLVKAILEKAKKIELLYPERGKYFRVVADLVADGVFIKDFLLSKSLAVPYSGGRKKVYDWCSLKSLPLIHKK